MKQNAFRIVLILLLMFLFSCGSKQVEDPISAQSFRIGQASALHGSTDEERDVFYRYETLYLTLQDLFAGWQTSVEIVQGNNCYAVHEHLLGITNTDGRIEDLPIWQYIGVDANGNVIDQSGDYAIRIVQPNHEGTWNIFRVEFSIVNHVPPFAHVRSTAADGSFRAGTAQVGEDIYATGGGFAADTNVRLYVVNDQSLYPNGFGYTDVSGGFETITTQTDGTVPNTLVWPGAAETGAFDIIVDTAPLGEYNEGDAVADMKSTGLLIQNPSSANDIVQDIACDALGTHQNQFDELDPIFARVDPLVQPGEISVPVGLYVTDHQDVWSAGDQLTSVETVGSHSSPTLAVANPVSGSLPLVIMRGRAKENNRQPEKLWPGDYDVVLDMNQNRVYDPGVDILDGGSQVGFTVTGDGAEPDVKLFAGTYVDYDKVRNANRQVYAQVLQTDGTPIAGATVYFNVGKGPGQVNPESATTDANGVAITDYTGAQYGQWSIIRVRVQVEDAWYYYWISVWGQVPCTHDQGILIGG